MYLNQRRSLALATLAAMALAAPGGRAQACNHDHDGDLEDRDTAARRVSWDDRRVPKERRVPVQILGFNDFHGQLSPRVVSGRPAGGAAVLAAYLEAARSGREDETIIVHAGDHVGASPPSSALLQDEPAISVLNLLANDDCRHLDQVDGVVDGSGASTADRAAHRRSRWAPWLDPECNVVGATGNHEYDEGRGELLRLLTGGNHPAGPFLEESWRGARYPTLAANVVDAESGEPLLPPYVVKRVNGERIGFIGLVLEGTPSIVTPTGVAGLTYLDEADTANEYVRVLKRKGVRAIVVVIHQGGRQTSYAGPTSSDGVIDGPDILDILHRLDDEVDVVVSGHAHAFTNALVKNANGKEILVTQAYSASTAYADIELEIDRRTGDVASKTAEIPTTWGDAGPGLSPHPGAAAIVAAADEKVAPLVNRVIARAQGTISKSEDASGESALGNLIADAQRASVPGAHIALMNPGGIRADLVAQPNGDVTWGALFTVQPFGNSLVAMDLTGAQVLEVLERQWLNQPFARILKPSGITYTWDAAQQPGSRIVPGSVQIGGAALDPSAAYRVVVNSFLAAGGDNFTTFASGTNRVGGAIDLDALIAHITALPQPFTAAIEQRIQRVN